MRKLAFFNLFSEELMAPLLFTISPSVDTGPSDLHAHAGIGEHPGFSEGIL